MFVKRENERGAITIEATISLSAFMFVIVTLLTIVNICIVQAKVACAINATANEISQYSYLYSLTGFNQSEGDVYNAGKEQTKEDEEAVEQILEDVNTVYNEIENLGNTGKQTPDNVDDILKAWDGVKGSVDNIKSSGSSIASQIEKIADDPKNLLMGIAKIAAVKSFDLVKSRLIAAPLAKVMCKKHLVDKKDGNVDAYLKYLGVVPSATGSYLDGLDFKNSALFPYGSSEICISVSYDVKVIPLLPVNFKFHFNQTAITHGWLAGDVSFQSLKKFNTEANETLWTQSTVEERSNFIRHMVIKDMQDEGYKKTSGLTDVQLYSESEKEFVMISSMNPLWSADGETAKTLSDIDDSSMQRQIERLCGKMKSTTDNIGEKVTVKTENNGGKKEVNCSGAKNKIVLVVPEDEGLKDKIEGIIAKSDTKGVEIEVVASCGKGARTSKQESTDKGE